MSNIIIAVVRTSIRSKAKEDASAAWRVDQHLDPHSTFPALETKRQVAITLFCFDDEIIWECFLINEKTS